MIKVIMDKSQAILSSAVAEELKDVGVPLVVKTGSRGGYMHIKALVADDVLLFRWSSSITIPCRGTQEVIQLRTARELSL